MQRQQAVRWPVMRPRLRHSIVCALLWPHVYLCCAGKNFSRRLTLAAATTKLGPSRTPCKRTILVGLALHLSNCSEEFCEMSGDFEFDASCKRDFAALCADMWRAGTNTQRP